MSEKLTVVNLFGGPSTGKSTNAALLFGLLKNALWNAEYTHEFAKDLTWENRREALEFQPYVFAKQLWKLQRLVGKVEVVVTDSPLLLSLVYAKDEVASFGSYVLENFNRFDNVNIFLRRNLEVKPYQQAGRSQSQEEAERKDGEIAALLHQLSIPYHEVPIEAELVTACRLLNLVTQHMQYKRDRAAILCPFCQERDCYCTFA